MASLPAMKPLDGADGFLRWKETVLLHLHAAGIGHVLSEDPPSAYPSAAAAAAAAARSWTRDDAVCRGHILAAVSDRLLPDYVRYGTGRSVWEAVARTYDVEMETRRAWHWQEEFDAFTFDRGTGALLLEQLAHAEALGVAAGLPDDCLADKLSVKLPELVCFGIILPTGRDKEMPMGMSLVWRIARRVVAIGMTPERLWRG